MRKLTIRRGLRHIPGMAVATLLLGAAHAVYAAPTIDNGTFDTPVPLNSTGGGWTNGGNDGAGGWRAAPGVNVSFTNYFIINAAGGTATDPFLSQVVDGFEVGHTYRITGDYENAYTGFGDPTALSFGVEIVELGLLLQLPQPAPDGSIDGFSLDFVALDTTLRLTSERNGDDSSYGVDNIAIADLGASAVPEPGTFGLVAAGLLAFARLRRRT